MLLFTRKKINTQLLILLDLLVFTAIFSIPAQADENDIVTSHGFALYGELKYPKEFKHFDYVNPNAPKGGTLRLMGFGSFDTLNPYTLKGTSPFNSPGMFMYGFGELNETLLAGTGSYSPSGDEPQSAYGLLAESLSYPSDFSWVTFKLRNQASFHDGHPIDANDVAFSYNLLLNNGHPRFQQLLLGVESVNILNSKEVKFSFKEASQAANILRVGELPILPQHFWEDKDFEKSSSIIPLLSGPYKIKDYKIGHSVSLERVKQPWFSNVQNQELGIYRGRYNFNNVVIDFYRDQAVAFEAFKANNFDMFYDYTAKNWAMAYDFPAIDKGEVKKAEIKHQIPSTTQAFFFNLRKPLFKDLRVRKAISLMFDFEWTNKALFNSAYQRNLSYYPNSPFSATGIPEGNEVTLLEKFKNQLPEGILDRPFTLPINKGDGSLRKPRREALSLLKDAGWTIKNGKLVNSVSNEVFSFEILIRQAGIQRVLMPFIKNLEKIGIQATPRMIDTTQYKVRLDQFDYDMTTVSLSQGHAPSYEQRDYFHSSTVNIEGSQNYAGISNPVVDELIKTSLEANSYDDLVASMKALDRVLLWNYYTIPNWHLNYHRLAYWNKFGKPTLQPVFKLGTENWWSIKEHYK